MSDDKLTKWLLIFREVCMAQLDPEHCAHKHIDWQSLRAEIETELQAKGER